MKSKLLAETEIGEYALFWLGAHAQVRLKHELDLRYYSVKLR